MASIRNFKKEINYQLGDVIASVHEWESTHKSTPESKQIVDDSIDVYEKTLAKIRSKSEESTQTHFAKIRTEYEEDHQALKKRVDKL